jgi:MFS family permease
VPAAGLRLGALRARAIGSPKYNRWLLWVTLTGLFSATFPGTILSISIRTIARDLHSQPGTITWVTTGPLLAGAVCTPVLGRLGDIRGHRRLYLAGMIAAAAFSLLTAAAWNPFSLILFRTLSQVGAAALVPSTFAMLFRSFPPAERVRASSLAQGTLAAAAMFGVVIGGPLVDLIGWRSIFIIQAAMCLLVLLPALLVLRPDEPVEVRAPIDYAGAVALAVATFALTFGVNRLGVWGVTPLTVGSLVVVPIGIWALIRIERRAAAPLLPLQLLSSRNTWFVVATSFCIGISWMGTLLLSPLYLQSVLGLSVGVTALIVAPRAGTGMLVAPLAGRLGVRFGERKLVIGCSVVIAATMGLLAVGAELRSIAIIATAIAISGTCMASAQAGLIAAAGHSVDAGDFGVAVSLQQTSNQIGSVLGLGLFAAIAADATTSGPFILVFLLAGAMAALAAGFAAGLRRKHTKHTQDGRDAPPATLITDWIDETEPLTAIDPVRSA